jgi:cold shock CspA family protein
LWPPRPAAYDPNAVIKTGRIEFYDRPTAWGLIMGDDQELYVVRGRDGRGLVPRVGERVSFEAQGMTDGKRAAEVRLVSRGLTAVGREAAAGGVRPLR